MNIKEFQSGEIFTAADAQNLMTGGLIVVDTAANLPDPGLPMGNRQRALVAATDTEYEFIAESGARYWRVRDTGWVDVDINSGFASQPAAAEKPRVRRRNGVVYYSGGFTNAGFVANATNNPGVVPAGFRPVTSVGLASILTGAVHMPTARVLPSGTIDVRTPATVSGYYMFSATWLADSLG